MNTTIQTEQKPKKFPEERPAICPVVDIHETKDAYLLLADLPGVTKQGVEILLEGNQLTIIGRRNWPATGSEAVLRESKPADFRRTFELDPSIDTSRIDAHVESGVLALHLAKAEHVKPRRIVVSG